MGMVFTEFLRLLVQIADLATSRDSALCDRLSLPKRFDAFLKHVFIPALRTPYSPPVVEMDDKVAGNSDQELGSEEDDEGLGNKDDAAGSGKADAAEEEPATIEPWRGFDDGRIGSRAGYARTGRTWPKGYEQELALWC